MVRVTDTGRRSFLKLSGGLLSAATVGATGCLNGEDGVGYTDWVPATFDPTVTYLNLAVLSQHHRTWEGGSEDTPYGLEFDDVVEVVGTSDAEVLILDDEVTPEVDGDEVSEHGGMTIYERDTRGAGFVGSDGDVLIEATTHDAVEAVIDARTGETARLRDEDETFDTLTRKAGEGDLVVVPDPDTRGVTRREARAAQVSEGTSDVRIAVHAEEDEFLDAEDEIRSREHLTVDEAVEEDADAEVLVLNGTVETEDLPGVFGLVAEASGSDEVAERDEPPQSADETGEETGGETG